MTGASMRIELTANSLLLSAGTTLLAGALGLITALWAATLNAASRKLFCLLAIVALAMPPFLQVNCWLDLLGASGSLREWVPFNIYSKGGAIWLLSLLTWPIFFGFGLSAWSRIDVAQIESDPALGGIPLI